MLSEIAFAARRLLRDRWSAAAAVLVAALGTGLNTAVFAVAYGILVRPLPYRDATRVAVADVSLPFVDVDDWRGARAGLSARGVRRTARSLHDALVGQSRPALLAATDPLDALREP